MRRLQDMIQEGAAVRDYDSVYVDSAPMSAWRTRVIAFLKRTLGPTDTYAQSFAEETADPYHSARAKGVAILTNLRADVESGYMASYYLGVAGEVVTDLLDLAAWALTEGSKEAAAILGGSGLELGLRRVAVARDVDINRVRGIDDINAALADAGVYNTLRRSQVDAWRVLRNHAIHGQHGEYGDAEVRLMIEGVRAFLAEELR